MTRLLLLALLAIAGRSPEPMASCLAARRGEIISAAEIAGGLTGVPLALLLVVGFRETHLGCHPRSGGGWGAPVDRLHRHTAGTAVHAARALSRGFAHCGSWEGAAAFFRCGLCTCPYAPTYAPTTVRWVERVSARAGYAPPSHLRAPATFRRTAPLGRSRP